nr:MAG TPA: Sodium/potassium-transporting ATPase subunit alpha-1 [Caudoviricetes sp.]
MVFHYDFHTLSLGYYHMCKNISICNIYGYIKYLVMR